MRVFVLVAVCALAGCGPTARPHAAVAVAESPPRVLTPAPADCPRAASLDPDAVTAEAGCLLTRYVQIDTTNPPGNELAAARFLREVLARDGVEARILESTTGRANLYARLPGREHGGGLLLLHHMDVVPAHGEDWRHPPFGGEVHDGELWGRGSLDDKGAGIVDVLAALLLRRLNMPLQHDLILLAVADEEAGGARGARELLAQHPELFEGVQQVLNEGGAILELEPGKPVYMVERAQKAPLWLALVAEGEAGHASSPQPDAATHALVRALFRLQAHAFPIQVVPEVQALFADRAQGAAEPLRGKLLSLQRSLQDPSFRAQFLSDPRQAALVQNTLAITMLTGSDKENVLPSRASAVLDLRLLPGQQPDAVVAELQRVMAEPSLRIERLLSWQSVASPRDTPAFHAIEALAASRDPGVPVVPHVSAGFTDCNAFRLGGIDCYGFVPLRIDLEALRHVHGTDERISLSAVVDAVDATLQLIGLLNGSPSGARAQPAPTKTEEAVSATPPAPH